MSYTFKKLQLPEVTFLGVDCVDVTRLIDIASIWSRYIDFGDIKILSSIPSSHTWVKSIAPITSKEEYSRFAILEMNQYVSTSHVLIFQYDGFILNPDAWTNNFLQYDYIGAPWWFHEGNNVGNGGFCLRSKKLLDLIARETTLTEYHPEDLVIGRNLYEALVQKGIRFAPSEVATKFSFEGRNGSHDRWNGEFGFHGYAVTDVSSWDYRKYTRFFKDWRFNTAHRKKLKAYRRSLIEWMVPLDMGD